jgi:hypothetical protein
MTKLDHKPLNVDMECLLALDLGAGGHPKRFEARWLHEETVEEIVKTAWVQACAWDEGPTFMQKANHVHEELHVWDREELKGPSYQIKEPKRELEKRRNGDLIDENIASQKELLVRIDSFWNRKKLFGFNVHG